MISWGLIMTTMGLVTNFTGLFVARLFLGVAEAGLYSLLGFGVSDLLDFQESNFICRVGINAVNLAFVHPFFSRRQLFRDLLVDY